MKIIRFESKGKLAWGIVREKGIQIITGDIYTGISETKEITPLEEAKILPPVSPSKIIGVGYNYFELTKESKSKVPEEPLLFFKPPSASIGHLDHIIYPPHTNRVHYEGELGVVIGRKAKDVEENQALDYVLGYTIVNDITATDYLEKDRQQTTRVKGFDTFCPVGPVIATGLDPDNLNLETRLNGKTVQSSNTKDLIFKTAQLVSFISKVMTLWPGDLIATGTPPGSGPIKRGDVLEVEIEGIGILKNFVS